MWRSEAAIRAASLPSQPNAGRQAHTSPNRAVDVTDREAMAARIGRMDRAAPLDLVIANAGTAGQHLPHGPERTRTIFAVNLDGVLNTIEPAEAAMAAAVISP
jgi:NADP-dependent 3-hydroxy acid dehydrogenase YdfG